MIQRVSDQSKISALEGLVSNLKSIKDHTPEMKNKTKPQRDNSWQVNTPSQKLAKQDDSCLQRSSSICSARAGGLSDIGGPNKHLHIESANTIFDPYKSTKSLGMTSKEVTAAEKDSVAKIRAERDAKWKENNSPKIGEENTVMPRIAKASGPDGAKGWVPSHNMSIFDSKEFERLSPPPGESIEKRASKKDNSWREPSKSKNVKSESNAFLDGLLLQTNNKEEGSKNKRADSVDRLFSLFSKKSEQ